YCFFFSSRRRHTRSKRDWSSDVCSSDLVLPKVMQGQQVQVTLAAAKKLTKAPIPFTEGTLITAMKTAGKTLDDADEQDILKEARSEERRVGKESRWRLDG